MNLISLIFAMAIAAILSSILFFSEPGARKVRNESMMTLKMLRIAMKEYYLNYDLFPANNQDIQPVLGRLKLGKQEPNRAPIKEINVLEYGIIEVKLTEFDSSKKPLRIVLIPNMHNVPSFFEWHCYSSNWSNVVSFEDGCKLDIKAENYEEEHRGKLTNSESYRASQRIKAKNDQARTLERMTGTDSEQARESAQRARDDQAQADKDEKELARIRQDAERTRRGN